MANAEMYDYLSTITADYDYTLTIPCRATVLERGQKNIHIKEYDDESESRVARSKQSIMYVNVQFPNITEANAGTIFDLFHGEAKACGSLYSFRWTNTGEPVASRHTYVVRFASRLSRGVIPTYIYSIQGIEFKVLGRIVDP